MTSEYKLLLAPTAHQRLLSVSLARSHNATMMLTSLYFPLLLLAFIWVGVSGLTSTLTAPYHHQPASRSALFLSDAIKKGTVKWFNPKKGFGFITPEDGSHEVFVHQTAILKDGFRKLMNGETVEYQLEKDHTGRCKAVQVTTAAIDTLNDHHFIPQDHMALVEEDLIADADDVFRVLDVNNDGEISNAELRSYLESTGCSPQVIRGLFTALDTNADGAISLEEMRFAFTHYEASALQTAFGLDSHVTNSAIQEAVGAIRLEAGMDNDNVSPTALRLLADLVFDMIDDDGSGEIDTSELYQHFMSVNKENSKESVEAILSALDIDSSGTISREEMREGVCNYNYQALKKALGLGET